MSDSVEQGMTACRRTLAALAGGGVDVDWDGVESHLQSCEACASGLGRFTAAIEEQFAASRALDAIDLSVSPGGIPAAESTLAGRNSDRIIEFPMRTAAGTDSRSGSTRLFRRALFGLGAVAAVLLVAVGIVTLLPGSSGSHSVSADRRPEFVPSLEVLPARASHIYYTGEQIQVCLRINQPSRVHLSVLEGHTTFTLYDADTAPGEHCFPEQVTALAGRATLRVEVFFGAERVAREDFTLLPAGATAVPSTPGSVALAPNLTFA